MEVKQVRAPDGRSSRQLVDSVPHPLSFVETLQRENQEAVLLLLRGGICVFLYFIGTSMQRSTNGSVLIAGHAVNAWSLAALCVSLAVLLLSFTRRFQTSGLMPRVLIFLVTILGVIDQSDYLISGHVAIGLVAVVIMLLWFYLLPWNSFFMAVGIGLTISAVPMVQVINMSDLNGVSALLVVGAIFSANAIGAVCAYQRSENVRLSSQYRSQLFTIATTDILTNLPNKPYFLDLARREFIRARSQKSRFAVLQVNLEKLNSSGKQSDQSIADRAVITTANVLRENTRRFDVIGHINPETFLVLILDCGTLPTAVQVTKRIIAQMSTRFVESGGKRFYPTINIGVSYSSVQTSSFSELLEQSAKALLKARRGGSNQYSIGT